MSQIPLDLRLRETYSLERLIIPDLINPIVQTWLFEPLLGSQGLILVGGGATGKTHLCHAFVETRGALLIEPGDIMMIMQSQNNLGPSETAVLIDDAHLSDQEALFHLYNRCVVESRPLCLSMNKNPLAWKYEVLDLESRLKALRILDMGCFVDHKEEAILRKLFADRAITPTDDLIDYLLHYADRSIDSMRHMVDGLHDYANGRAFSRALAKDYLSGHDPRQYSLLPES